MADFIISYRQKMYILRKGLVFISLFELDEPNGQRMNQQINKMIEMTIIEMYVCGFALKVSSDSCSDIFQLHYKTREDLNSNGAVRWNNVCFVIH